MRKIGGRGWGTQGTTVVVALTLLATVCSHSQPWQHSSVLRAKVGWGGSVLRLMPRPLERRGGVHFATGDGIPSMHPSRRRLWEAFPFAMALRGGASEEEDDSDDDKGSEDARAEALADSMRYTWAGMRDEVDPPQFKEGDLVVPIEKDSWMSDRQRRAMEACTSPKRGVDADTAWWKTMDDNEILRDHMQAWLDETTCCGTGPHTMIGWRFDGRCHRERSVYLNESETDEQMFSRHMFGWATNDTLKGLYDLKCNDHAEIGRLVTEQGVDVNGLVDTLGEERAIHWAAYNGDYDTVKLLVDLGACPNARNFYNQTAMHRAAAGGYTQLCDYLVKCGAEPLPIDAFDLVPPVWASMSNKNETCQWFFARFVELAGKKYPRGPPPFYGLEQNAGYEFFCAYEEWNITTNIMQSRVEPNCDILNDNSPENAYRLAKEMAAEEQEAEEERAAAEARLEEVVDAKGRRVNQAREKRGKISRAAFIPEERDAMDQWNPSDEEEEEGPFDI